jgi:DNA polymerase elongation subunit (family B)
LGALYLVDAGVTQNNALKLKLLDHSGTIQEFVDDKFKPYFLMAYPLTREDEEVVNYFSGTVEPVEKLDLFNGQKRTLARVSWPNAKIAEKAAEKLRVRWESDVDFLKSYVYDHGLNFGALHSEQDLKPILDVSADAVAEQEKSFLEVQAVDPEKHSKILHWLRLLDQPVPTVDLSPLGIKQADLGKVYSAWMLSRIANLPLAQAFGSTRVSDWWKSMISEHLRSKNVLIPTPQELTRGMPTHTVTGALTVAPRAGAYFNTVVCDFESLYAGCIDSFNLSYETVNCGHHECEGNRIPDFDGHVCTQRRGFYAVLVGALKELRIRIFKSASKDTALPEEKRKMAGITAKLLKLILVSSYGVTVRIHGLACPPLAESITGYGRFVLKESWRMAEQGGLRPLYGDTDSLFLDNPSNEQVGWLIRTVKEQFWLDLVVDKRYSLCVLPKAKKAYFGIMPDGTPDVKGVTAIKSNSPGYINRVFNECVKELSAVKNAEEYTQAAKRIGDTVRKGIADLRGNAVELKDLLYSVRLYFDPNEKTREAQSLHQPYQCALQLIDAGKKLKRGDTVSFVKVKPFVYKGRIFSVKPAEKVTSLTEINVEDYARNLRTALEQVFEPMGIRLKAVIGSEAQRWF